MRRIVRRLKRATKRAANSAIGAVTIGLLKLLRLTNPDTMGNITGWFMRTVGPLLPENRIGRANLTAAFPEKSHAEIDTILRGVWDNLGRIAAEFAHLDRLADFDPWHPERSTRIEARQADLNRLFKILEQPKPAIVFGAHFGNWELPAVCAAACKFDTAVLYRRPNNPAIDKWLHETRAAAMGTLIPTGLDAPMKLADALARGVHIGMLVDQYYSRGVDVTFFGQRTKANPLLVIKGGVLDGKALSPEEITKLADLESREVLLAKLAGAMNASLSKAVYLFAAPLSQTARVVDALRAKVEAEGPVAPAAAAEETTDEAPAAEAAADVAEGGDES